MLTPQIVSHSGFAALKARPHASRGRGRTPMASATALAMGRWLAAMVLLAVTPLAAAGGPSAPTSSRVIQYRGPMPLLPDEARDGEVSLNFELYRSPTGGVPFWSETRVVTVRDRWVEVDLGEVEQLPDEAFDTPFRFLSIWHGDVEFKPRKQVVSVAYVAATRDEYASGAVVATPGFGDAGVAGEYPGGSASAVAAKPQPLGATVAVGDVSIEVAARAATHWLGAEQAAAAAGGRLPTFEEWYAAVDGSARAHLRDITGHYEWVIPWVYEPQIHARMHELYRGKPVACYYNELSPQHAYPYRLVALEAVQGVGGR